MHHENSPEIVALSPEATMLEADLQPWHDRMEALMAQGARIITLRGAGTVHGIEPHAAQLATAILHDYVTHITSEGTPVALLCDGDTDNRQKPDVGSIFGGLIDRLGANAMVTRIVAQTESWYNPRIPNGGLESATGKPYETYVFSDQVEGKHASLTQSDQLVAYGGYEQIFVGPVGPIAYEQLQDLNQKAMRRSNEVSSVKVTVLTAQNNPALDEQLHEQLNSTADPLTYARIATKVVQREQQPYGALCSPVGTFALDESRYPGVSFAAIAL